MYISPVDGTALQEIERDGVVVYRDASSGVEYSQEYVEANCQEVKEAKGKAKAPAKDEPADSDEN